MSDENEDDAPVLYVLQSDENSEDFMEKFHALLIETKELGPVVHCCLISQAMGALCFNNLPAQLEHMRRNVLLNFEQGVQLAMDVMIQDSQREKPN